jgi:hypothetical protein
MNKAMILAFVVACGGGGTKPSDPSNTGGTASTTTSTTPAGDGVYGGAAYGGYKISPELTAFKNAIADKQSVTDACPASAQLHDAAGAIAANPPPPQATDPEIWKGELNELVAISEDFITHCAASDAATTQYDLEAMHSSFQRLLLQLPPSP